MFRNDLISSQTQTNGDSQQASGSLSTLAGRGKPKAFQDSCHNNQSLYFSPLAVSIIDTPEFQRLRRLQQLGTASSVFPGAVHTRFQHSLGTYHFAKLLMRTIREKQPELELTSRDVEVVSIAGLCHDLGHGPFSHAFESFIDSAGVHFEHEDMSAKLVGRIAKHANLVRDESELETWNDVHTLEAPPYLSARDIVLIRCMISCSERAKHHELIKLPPHKLFMMDIVCNSRNSIDVDKFDYLIRDAFYCGLSAAPMYRLIENCRVIDGVLCYQKKVLKLGSRLRKRSNASSSSRNNDNENENENENDDVHNNNNNNNDDDDDDKTAAVDKRARNDSTDDDE
eukprot:TRINITY_DN293_c0_g1_i3.p1 TRINITY_DN293_c0_g1~~TRINITY_DN293_c0_g1_i3.p1  ORF type:complete len:355 (-),score=114.97 TRINITY_DN293_c0_g1_i3:57-1079(-)